MVSQHQLLLHPLQLMYLWLGAFWDPHLVLDTHPRRLFFLLLTYLVMYKIHRVVSGAVNVSPNSPPESSSVN